MCFFNWRVSNNKKNFKNMQGSHNFFCINLWKPPKKWNVKRHPMIMLVFAIFLSMFSYYNNNNNNNNNLSFSFLSNKFNLNILSFQPNNLCFYYISHLFFYFLFSSTYFFSSSTFFSPTKHSLSLKEAVLILVYLLIDLIFNKKY